MNQLQIAQRNIKLYVFVRIFAKRVFIPLTAIYFIEKSGFTIMDIGILSAFFSLVQLVAEVPTGYFADKVGRVASIRTGSLLAALATLIYVYTTHKSGIYLGTMLEALGYSFLGGAGEALIHDSLVVQNKVQDYTKILSRTMSISLVANAILISLVPMTYYFNHNYPFLLGTLAYLLLFTATLFLQDVSRTASAVKLVLPDLHKITGKRHILLFGLSFGIIAALYSSPVDVINVALKTYGLRVEWIGWIYGLASILGAVLGLFIHYLRHIRLSRYLLIDIFILLSLYLSATSHNALILSVVVIIGIAFWRYRRIIYQDYLLTIYPTSYKATLISAMNNLEQLNSIWLPLLITLVVSRTSIPHGFGIMAGFTLTIAPIFYFSALKFFDRDPLPVV